MHLSLLGKVKPQYLAPSAAQDSSSGILKSLFQSSPEAWRSVLRIERPTAEEHTRTGGEELDEKKSCELPVRNRRYSGKNGRIRDLLHHPLPDPDSSQKMVKEHPQAFPPSAAPENGARRDCVVEDLGHFDHLFGISRRKRTRDLGNEQLFHLLRHWSLHHQGVFVREAYHQVKRSRNCGSGSPRHSGRPAGHCVTPESFASPCLWLTAVPVGRRSAAPPPSSGQYGAQPALPTPERGSKYADDFHHPLGFNRDNERRCACGNGLNA